MNAINEILTIKVLERNLREISFMNLEQENAFLTMTQTTNIKIKYLYIWLDNILKFWMKK